MAAGWEIVAFPVILPWQGEFWTLPLYFPDLKVGVLPGWPAGLPYPGLALPPEAEAPGRELRHYRPGDLRQWHAFAAFGKGQEDTEDIVRALRGGSPEAPARTEPTPDPWGLAWQMEKIQADQEVQLLRVDQGQGWLAEILATEPWEKESGLRSAPGLREVVDPDLAWMRYRLWRRVMAPYLKELWTPFLLGRTSRAIFLTLKGWPEWTLLKQVRVSLPGCRSEAEFLAAQKSVAPPKWLPEFRQRLAKVLDAAAASQELEAAARDLQQFVETAIARHWPGPNPWPLDLEIWARDPESDEDLAPVLCWAGTGAGILPG